MKCVSASDMLWSKKDAWKLERELEVGCLYDFNRWWSSKPLEVAFGESLGRGMTGSHGNLAEDLSQGEQPVPRS